MGHHTTARAAQTGPRLRRMDFSATSWREQSRHRIGAVESEHPASWWWSVVVCVVGVAVSCGGRLLRICRAS